MLRQTFLFLSRQKSLRRWSETSAAAQRLTRRFVAGNALDDVLSVATSLQGQSIYSSLDHLGENVSNPAEAEASRAGYEQALAAIEQRELPSTISIKLTQLGLDLSEDTCYRHAAALAESARRIRTRVEIDMESSEYTDRTLSIVEKLHKEFGSVRTVVQAYLYRTEEDVRRLCRQSIPVRLCKGAYDEPSSVAFPKKEDVDLNYVKLARILLDHGIFPAMATHDPAIIDAILDHVRLQNYPPERFEFQMLYGVRRDLQDQLVKQKFLLRLYVPYGDAWYPYFMRRLAERPANVFFIARNMMRR
jgi:proline dehydrogenase